ncbi:Dynein light chain, type 1/2 domain-containing protein [Rozella allomycis CSF55]|uniref:Dynein axonemal light chain 4 n=1 Tax=Rozella allomycis (strain CSF55) TaxID=988480 RepID=A0A075ATT5_ROZAC|nr:Dynein light chain, type 1/2 domain-containing protein [Rozella allomycis CSF55]|eukprot:EPZ33663.1 Dynein light chain, type 1/2 domain-containing protein [Rozella allomycis CSF55]
MLAADSNSNLAAEKPAVTNAAPEKTEDKDSRKTFTYALVKYSDMMDEVRTETVDTVVTAIEKHQGNYEMASKMVKEAMDKKFGSPWHVVIGEGFSFEIVHEMRNLLFMYFGGQIVYGDPCTNAQKYSWFPNDRAVLGLETGEYYVGQTITFTSNHLRFKTKGELLSESFQITKNTHKVTISNQIHKELCDLTVNARYIELRLQSDIGHSFDSEVNTVKACPKDEITLRPSDSFLRYCERIKGNSLELTILHNNNVKMVNICDKNEKYSFEFDYFKSRSSQYIVFKPTEEYFEEVAISAYSQDAEFTTFDVFDSQSSSNVMPVTKLIPGRPFEIRYKLNCLSQVKASLSYKTTLGPSNLSVSHKSTSEGVTIFGRLPQDAVSLEAEFLEFPSFRKQIPIARFNLQVRNQDNLFEGQDVIIENVPFEMMEEVGAKMRVTIENREVYCQRQGTGCLIKQVAGGLYHVEIGEGFPKIDFSVKSGNEIIVEKIQLVTSNGGKSDTRVYIPGDMIYVSWKLKYETAGSKRLELNYENNKGKDVTVIMNDTNNVKVPTDAIGYFYFSLVGFNRVRSAKFETTIPRLEDADIKLRNFDIESKNRSGHGSKKMAIKTKSFYFTMAPDSWEILLKRDQTVFDKKTVVVENLKYNRFDIEVLNVGKDASKVGIFSNDKIQVKMELNVALPISFEITARIGKHVEKLTVKNGFVMDVPKVEEKIKMSFESPGLEVQEFYSGPIFEYGTVYFRFPYEEEINQFVHERRMRINGYEARAFDMTTIGKHVFGVDFGFNGVAPVAVNVEPIKFVDERFKVVVNNVDRNAKDVFIFSGDVIKFDYRLPVGNLGTFSIYGTNEIVCENLTIGTPCRLPMVYNFEKFLIRHDVYKNAMIEFYVYPLGDRLDVQIITNYERSLKGKILDALKKRGFGLYVGPRKMMQHEFIFYLEDVRKKHESIQVTGIEHEPIPFNVGDLLITELKLSLDYYRKIKVNELFSEETIFIDYKVNSYGRTPKLWYSINGQVGQVEKDFKVPFVSYKSNIEFYINGFSSKIIFPVYPIDLKGEYFTNSFSKIQLSENEFLRKRNVELFLVNRKTRNKLTKSTFNTFEIKECPEGEFALWLEFNKLKVELGKINMVAQKISCSLQNRLKMNENFIQGEHLKISCTNKFKDFNKLKLFINSKQINLNNFGNNEFGSEFKAFKNFNQQIQLFYNDLIVYEREFNVIPLTSLILSSPKPESNVFIDEDELSFILPNEICNFRNDLVAEVFINKRPFDLKKVDLCKEIKLKIDSSFNQVNFISFNLFDNLFETEFKVLHPSFQIPGFYLKGEDGTPRKMFYENEEISFKIISNICNIRRSFEVFMDFDFHKMTIDVYIKLIKPNIEYSNESKKFQIFKDEPFYFNVDLNICKDRSDLSSISIKQGESVIFNGDPCEAQFIHVNSKKTGSSFLYALYDNVEYFLSEVQVIELSTSIQFSSSSSNNFMNFDKVDLSVNSNACKYRKSFPLSIFISNEIQFTNVDICSKTKFLIDFSSLNPGEHSVIVKSNVKKDSLQFSITEFTLTDITCTASTNDPFQHTITWKSNCRKDQSIQGTLEVGSAVSSIDICKNIFTVTSNVSQQAKIVLPNSKAYSFQINVQNSQPQTTPPTEIPVQEVKPKTVVKEKEEIVQGKSFNDILLGTAIGSFTLLSVALVVVLRRNKSKRDNGFYLDEKHGNALDLDCKIFDEHTPSSSKLKMKNSEC